jgi:toluene monooxygenase system ferredoxin subunit
MAFVRVAALEELWTGEPASRQGVLLLRRGDTVLAYEDRCAHLGVALSEGRLEGDTLTCSAHEWTYDVRTGRGINPASACLKAFPVRIEDGQVWVDRA